MSDNPTGRPSAFTQEIAETICTRISDGESLRKICAEDGMPDKSTVFRWLFANLGFRDQYARAREYQAETLVDEIIEISDDGTNDWMERKNADGSTGDVILNGEHIQRSRLRVDTRKWFASKVAPKKYGEKILAEHTGPDGGALIIEHRNRISAEIKSLMNEEAPALPAPAVPEEE